MHTHGDYRAYKIRSVYHTFVYLRDEEISKSL